MSFFHNIKNQKNLTSGEKNVANYIIENPNKVIISTVTILAESTHTSLGTVLRLIKKLGYKTFGEFKLALTVSIVENKNKKQEQESSPLNIIDKILESIHTIKDSLDYDNIKLAASLIHNSNKIIIYGYGASHSIAYFLYFKLLKLGLPAVLINNSYEATAITPYKSNNETVILISGSGSSKRILHLAKEFKDSKNNVISLTNMSRSPLSPLSDCVLYGGIPDDQLNSGAAYSRIPLMALSEYLIHTLMNEYDLESNVQRNNHKLSMEEF